MLKRWVDNFATGRYEKDRALPLEAAQQLENEQLRRELANVRMERDILISSQPPEVLPAVISALEGALEKYRVGTNFQVPAVAIFSVGTRP